MHMQDTYMCAGYVLQVTLERSMRVQLMQACLQYTHVMSPLCN